MSLQSESDMKTSYFNEAVGARRQVAERVRDRGRGRGRGRDRDRGRDSVKENENENER